MVESTPVSGIQPTQEERTLAILAHLLQIVAWWIAPLVIFIIKRNSKFVSFHALQALLLQCVYLFLMCVGVVLWFGTFFIAMASSPATRNGHPPPELFILMPLFGLGWISAWIAMIGIAVVYGVRAGRGEWATYPFLGQLALKILKLGPGGVPL